LHTNAKVFSPSTDISRRVSRTLTELSPFPNPPRRYRSPSQMFCSNLPTFLIPLTPVSRGPRRLFFRATSFYPPSHPLPSRFFNAQLTFRKPLSLHCESQEAHFFVVGLARRLAKHAPTPDFNDRASAFYNFFSIFSFFRPSPAAAPSSQLSRSGGPLVLSSGQHLWVCFSWSLPQKLIWALYRFLAAESNATLSAQVPLLPLWCSPHPDPNTLLFLCEPPPNAIDRSPKLHKSCPINLDLCKSFRILFLGAVPARSPTPLVIIRPLWLLLSPL